MEVDHQTSRAAPKIQKVFLTLEFDEICNFWKSLEKSILEKWRTGRAPPIPKPHPVLPFFLPAAFPLPCPLSQLPLQDWHRHTLDILTPSPWLLDLFYRLFVSMLSSFQSHFHFLSSHFFFLISFVIVRGCPYISYYGIGGEGSSQFITILHRGGLPNLLQFYIGGVFKIYYNITVLKGKWKVIILFQL